MTKRFLLASAILGLLVLGTVSPIFATVDFNAYLPMAGTPITPEFKFTKNVAIDYSGGGKLKDLLNGKNMTVSFSDTSDNNTSIKAFMENINTEFATDRKTTATISSLKLDYQVQINGDDKGATIDYKITLTPTLNGYLLSKGEGTVPTVFDISWMGFKMTGPVVISSKLGDLDINSPLGIIQNQLPDVYTVLKGTAAETTLQSNLIDASALVSYPIEKWNSLFDPAYTLSDAVGYGYGGQKVAVTGFAYGQSDLYQGSLKPQDTDVDFTADAKYHLTVIERASSGTIDADGHANGYEVQGDPAISTTSGASTSGGTTTAQGLSTMTIYVMAGFAAVIAAGVFWFSNRKMKESLKRGVDNSPPPTFQYEDRKHWADKFDEEKKE
ncbi:exported protein of unknown function [Nitrosotalea devaniterrae]|uniref:Uncharacterized protein n=1 Tax=Nitrosotalea devaniterrae TaxID=1078905 RepID=A0A128A266_9ARCH|nr:exported protein of unknown function [Candidatus Nitrosotalea devanaterra]